MGKLKDNARKIIDGLPDDATLDDLMYELYVNEKIQRGLDAAEKGNVYSHEEIRKKFSK